MSHELLEDGGHDAFGPGGAERSAQIVGTGVLAGLLSDNDTGLLIDGLECAADWKYGDFAELAAQPTAADQGFFVARGAEAAGG